jgi:hypothetical protein
MNLPVQNRCAYTFTDDDIKPGAQTVDEPASSQSVMMRAWIAFGDFPHDDPLWKRLVEGKRERDIAWHRAEVLFRIAYVWHLLRLEKVSGHYIERLEDIGRTVDLITIALQGRPHSAQIPFARPTAADVQNWRSYYEPVLGDPGTDFDLFNVRSYENLLICISEDKRWFDVVREVHRACADSIRSIDPDSDLEIAPAMHRVAAERGFRDFDPDRISIASYL